MSRYVSILLILAVADRAVAEFDTLPIGHVRATTEIHGIPVVNAAPVEDNRFFNYPFDGSMVALIESSEVDAPPVSNIVQFRGTAEPLGEYGQRIELSFYGPNACDDVPADDLPIFVDLYGTYTDSDNPVGPRTGPVDLFAVQAFGLTWAGYPTETLYIDPATAGATVRFVDGTETQIGYNDHPFSTGLDLFGGGYGLRIGRLSTVFEFGDPFVPELLDGADEVHITFDVYVPEPTSALLLLGACVMVPRPRYAQREPK